MFRMIDWVRCHETDGPTKTEKVDQILEDMNRSARIALVATGEKKRYVIATHNMKPGDLIQSTQVLTRSPSKLFGLNESTVVLMHSPSKLFDLNELTLVLTCSPSKAFWSK